MKIIRTEHHDPNCQCGLCNNTGCIALIEEEIHGGSFSINYVPCDSQACLERDAYRRTLEHIAKKGRCVNPRQCAQEALDGDWKQKCEF